MHFFSVYVLFINLQASPEMVSVTVPWWGETRKNGGSENFAQRLKINPCTCWITTLSAAEQHSVSVLSIYFQWHCGRYSKNVAVRPHLLLFFNSLIMWRYSFSPKIIHFSLKYIDSVYMFKFQLKSPSWKLPAASQWDTAATWHWHVTALTTLMTSLTVSSKMASWWRHRSMIRTSP